MTAEEAVKHISQGDFIPVFPREIDSLNARRRYANGT